MDDFSGQDALITFYTPIPSRGIKNRPLNVEFDIFFLITVFVIKRSILKTTKQNATVEALGGAPCRWHIPWRCRGGPRARGSTPRATPRRRVPAIRCLLKHRTQDTLVSA